MLRAMTAQRWMYRWNEEGRLERIGAITMAYLNVWEYEAVSDPTWTVTDPERDQVRSWRTRRPDLAPPEILIGERQIDQAPVTQFVRSAPYSVRWPPRNRAT